MVFGIVLQTVGIALGIICVGFALVQIVDPAIHGPTFGIIPCIMVVADETLCDTLPPNALDPNTVGLARSHRSLLVVQPRIVTDRYCLPPRARDAGAYVPRR